MHITLRKLGNSRAAVIPEALLAQVGMTDDAELKVENGAIVLRPTKRTPREGWAEASQTVAADADEALAWPEFCNEADSASRWLGRSPSCRGAAKSGWRLDLTLGSEVQKTPL